MSRLFKFHTNPSYGNYQYSFRIAYSSILILLAAGISITIKNKQNLLSRDLASYLVYGTEGKVRASKAEI
jgi:hypothetical protein